MTIHLTDKKLFAIVLYSTFVNNEILTSIRDIWMNPWVTGITGAFAIKLVGTGIAPIILTLIMNVLGFGVEGVAAEVFFSWFMSLYEMVGNRSLPSFLRFVATAGLETFSTSISSGVGAIIGVLISAIGGPKLETYFSEMDLNSPEKQMLENMLQIKEESYQDNTNMIIFTLMPALLYNDTMLKCFVETFMTCSSFVESKLFRFDFKENDLPKLKSEEEKVNHTVYNLLINDYKESNIKYNYHNDYLIGYDLNLNDYDSSNNMIINLLVEIWKIINGNIVMETEFEKIRKQIDKEIHKFLDFLHDHIHIKK
ncbi:hypothetical protein C1645_734971 [Glomus cerebriforme]|uniref:Uncharacterized protein n=1 Tax=Glomus cerebriforme TaxID=658196 RepID=A0A397TH59_9GLOM|nr:hypothetical protein C1645_734971 [Glomus cerebriforme]